VRLALFFNTRVRDVSVGAELKAPYAYSRGDEPAKDLREVRLIRSTGNHR
jgi:hypothetical protein